MMNSEASEILKNREGTHLDLSWLLGPTFFPAQFIENIKESYLSF